MNVGSSFEVTKVKMRYEPGEGDQNCDLKILNISNVTSKPEGVSCNVDALVCLGSLPGDSGLHRHAEVTSHVTAGNQEELNKAIHSGLTEGVVLSYLVTPRGSSDGASGSSDGAGASGSSDGAGASGSSQ